MAEGQGFEPWELLHSTVFKTAAFGRSATPPRRRQIIHGLKIQASVLSLGGEKSHGSARFNLKKRSRVQLRFFRC